MQNEANLEAESFGCRLGEAAYVRKLRNEANLTGPARQEQGMSWEAKAHDARKWFLFLCLGLYRGRQVPDRKP